ncbi:MAG TPA: 4-hydroxy-3-methylbut-2-enyl diphosphate reductase [Flavobacteriales bacterium]|nr:4-hydroxy-3-methylbut-2-enyl diphosphate reductase [Flavobacteriales bacterium]HRE75810.1 4-hydroxy-3-methylbut-2-enyl diphosphate reductase [Flavobacteriales bacterium]HRE96554.1 4-hydroxy-3-methylbut-2-enyl diphosphate reductase [Flavobacteriales bacterium]HRJ39867.1 4-hydroxy-3-methylbut-2-enyl diphosphate reductase [Flavobacteriales bacterium]
MKNFSIPEYYRSPIISKVKEFRKQKDPRKKDFSPTLLDFGSVRFYIARHFGFCYGVENAIEISYRAIEENPGKRIFLLSQMIHNPEVNADLERNGIRFIMDTHGKHFLSWDEINKDDIVIIPAFGTTLEIEQLLQEKGIETQKYNTTCPFVEKVWNRAEKLGSESYTIIIHGKQTHEETRATFSHSKKNAPSIVIKDMKEAQILGDIVLGKMDLSSFSTYFGDRCSQGFDPATDLQRVGVINQTTMLATETQEIADYFKKVMAEKYPVDNSRDHFADTRDTLCYATNDNQQATLAMMDQVADLALVIGGYNSSNTTHLVELLEQKFSTYFITGEKEIRENGSISYFDIHHHEIKQADHFLPQKQPLNIIVTSGASCPDAVVDRVLQKVLMLLNAERSIEEVLTDLSK